tara:strand:- start:7528 stop:8163 length:636 start_codon:yes stop_codon:yes gene_type:complete
LPNGYIENFDDNIVYIYIMDQIYKQDGIKTELNNFPTIVKLKTIEKEIKLKLDDYRNSQKDYISALQNGSTDNAEDNLEKINALNSELVRLFRAAKILMSKVYPKGMQNQKIVSEGSSDLMALDNKLQKYNTKIAKVQKELNDIAAKRENTSLEAHSLKIQYYWISMNGILTALWIYFFLTSRSLRSLHIIFIAIFIFNMSYWLFTRYLAQ